MNPKLIFKSFQRSLKFLLLLSLFFGISNCKRDIDGPCDMSDIDFDTSYFEKNEKALLPDWKGDSLFFYSDAGDTAYLFCKYQGLGITTEFIHNGSSSCNWTYTYPYESFGATYGSNHPELNNIGIRIYKETYLGQQTPPFKQAVIDISVGTSAIGWYSLLDFDGKTLPNDSVLLANGKYESGWVKDSKTLRPIMNLKVGLIVIERKNVKKWTLFRYTLNN
jgi:hypothetical protein